MGVKFLLENRGHFFYKKRLKYISWLQRRLTDIEHERRRYNEEKPVISSKYLGIGYEYWTPPLEKAYQLMTPPRSPVKRKVEIGWTEPRSEEWIGYVDIRKTLAEKKNANENKQEKWSPTKNSNKTETWAHEYACLLL